MLIFVYIIQKGLTQQKIKQYHAKNYSTANFLQGVRLSADKVKMLQRIHAHVHMQNFFVCICETVYVQKTGVLPLVLELEEEKNCKLYEKGEVERIERGGFIWNF